MTAEREKNLDWLKEDDDEEKVFLSDQKHIEEESLQEETKDSKKNYQASDLPSWLKEEMASANNVAAESSKNRPRSTIKYRQPSVKKPPRKTSSSTNWCCPNDPVRAWFRIFHGLCGLIGVLSFISNLYVLFDVPLDIRNIVIHAYALLFCILVVGTELELKILLSRLQFLESWIFRGLFYFFVGVISGKTLVLFSLRYVNSLSSDNFSNNEYSSNISKCCLLFPGSIGIYICPHGKYILLLNYKSMPSDSQLTRVWLACNPSNSGMLQTNMQKFPSMTSRFLQLKDNLSHTHPIFFISVIT